SAAVQIVRRLRDAGHVSYFAGGCVRDHLRGETAHDIDIATSAHPEQVTSLFPRTIAVGAQFGVIIVLEGGAEFEVATFRSDSQYLDGRRPESVSFTDARTDAQRRDFTVNGLFYDPLADEVLDYVGGKADLAARTLRAIGDPADRFREDKLRVLRAIRFAATLDFQIDPTTWDAVRANATAIHAVSPERIRDELIKIFTAPSRVRGFDLLDSSGLLRILLPAVADLAGCEQPPEFHPEGDVFVHTRLMLDLLPPDASTELVFGVLFHDIGKPPTSFTDETGRIRFNGHEHVGAEMATRILKDLRFPNREIDDIVALVKNHMAFKDVQNMRVAKLKRFLARDTFDDELELHRVDCTSSHGLLDNHTFLIERREEFANEPLIPPPLVTGHDLIALGLTPGPAFKAILDAAQTAQLENAFPDRDAALEWLRAVAADQ
ncbi:MAG: CCA tRNA nucleotidyltransferase, partial [Chthoniobacterales bacterium]